MMSFVERDEGQALVIVGLAMIALLGAVALAVDWGFGYASRRELQNDADAAALTAGRRVASTFELVAAVPSGTRPAFEASQGEVCTEVAAGVRSPSATVEIAFFDDTNANDPSRWTTISTANCAAGAGVPVPATTVLVRARASATYPSLFNVINRGPIAVGAAARVRLTAGAAVRPLLLPSPLPPGAGRQAGVGLSGSTTAPNAPIWPFMMRFPDSRFAPDGACGRFCDQSGRKIRLWDEGAATRGGTVLVTLAHESVQQPGVHQLVTESDFTGSLLGEDGRQATGRLLNASSTLSCSIQTGKWDTLGGADEQNCDLPNWFRYGFRGSLSPETDWNDPAWRRYAGESSPSALPASRSSCTAARAQPYFPTRSCNGTSMRGDWVETVRGGLTPNMVLRMRDLVRQYGRDTVASVTQGWGKALVVNVFLWDCAEHFEAGEKKWKLQGSPADCSTFNIDPRYANDYRLHVFSVVPLTFYENLIYPADQTVDAFWGDAFGDAGSCQRDWTPPQCALNPLMNSAFLVPDE